jgi:phage recombination protein Bet
MSEVATINRENEQDVIRILGNSLYPGAKPESIQLVLAYCRANGMDPFLKPVHIVPTSIKVQSNPDKWEMRDVLMPGIADYRIKAARSGEYGGKSEPEFGPDVTKVWGDETVIFPAWCRVTVKRIVQGQAREFVANERWLENYATAGRNTDAPNKMWKKRAYGQLAKCAESQALRMAFPEFSAGYTAEEMEGRDTFDGPTIEAEPPLRAAATAMPRAPTVRAPAPAAPSDWLAPLNEPNGTVWLKNLDALLANAETQDEVVQIGGHHSVGTATAKAPPAVQARISEMLAKAFGKFAQPDASDAASDTGEELPEIRGEERVGAG